jgi:hypothetical protein
MVYVADLREQSTSDPIELFLTSKGISRYLAFSSASVTKPSDSFPKSYSRADSDPWNLIW